MTDLSTILDSFNPSDYLGKAAYTTTENPRIEAIRQIESYGLIPPSTIPYVGKLFRFKDATDKGKKQSAWGIYYEYIIDDGLIAVCVFGNYKGEPEKVVWCNKQTSYMTQAEQSALNENIEVAKREAEKIRQQEQGEAKKECQALWSKMPVMGACEYTRRKKINPIGARSNNGVLCLPVYVDGELSSLQYIADDGDKKFHENGKIQGGYMLIEGKGDVTYITEGYATGVSIHMATGANVYVCYNAGNIYEFCSWFKPHAQGKIIIAADDDFKTAGNPGMTKAKKAADVFGFDVIAPRFKPITERGTDFNDVHCLEGIEQLQKLLTAPQPKEKKTSTPKQEEQSVPPGVIDDIYRFYMATSGNHQPGFAIQTALALVSVMCSRYFITDSDNMTSLFFLNVGRTATGKEHNKRVVEHVLSATGFEDRIAGDGFTSGAAVVSTLLKKPTCITVTDEFGKYLEAAANSKGGMQKEANTTLMESIGRPDGVLRPKNYSTMTLKKDQADAMHNRVVYCPALTLYGLTTPNTFFDNVKIDSVLDGFLNRFIVHVSDAVRQPRKRTSMMDVPESIKKWANAIKAEIHKLNSLELSSEKPTQKRIFFTEQAYEEQLKFELEMIKLQDELEQEGLEGLPARANEWAMRLSLCLALSRDPRADSVFKEDMAWSCDYMRKATKRILKEVRTNMTENDYEKEKSQVYQAIIRYPNGISFSDMQKTKPFVKFKKKELEDILLSLVDAELVDCVHEKTKGRGRPTTVYKKIIIDKEEQY